MSVEWVGTINFHLDRFKKAQASDYDEALRQIKAGCKTGHWIWYIFPQLKELGFSENSKYYGISGIEEAVFYLYDKELKSRLLEITQALFDLDETNIEKVVGYPDDMKIRSCMTLFYYAAEELNSSSADKVYMRDVELFKAVIDKYFGGQFDKKTESLLSGWFERRKKSANGILIFEN